jgi:hypothetical protein
MGLGKGSSIRQLLPEEAIKLVRLMLSEPEQRISLPEKVPYPNPKQPMLNIDGTPAEHMEIHFRPILGLHDLWYEDMLNFHIARVFDDENSSFVNCLRPLLENMSWGNLEYASSMFPWGYTAATSDFVLAFNNGSFRDTVFVLELKRERVDDYAFIQTSLYVPWVVQVLAQSATPPPPRMKVIPVVVGLDLRDNVAAPQAYQYTTHFNSGVEVMVDVSAPRFLRYEAEQIYSCLENRSQYCSDIMYTDESERLRSIDWRPPPGAVT